MKIINDLEIIYLMRFELSIDEIVEKIESLVDDFKNNYNSLLDIY